jgi:hypothetical protein
MISVGYGDDTISVPLESRTWARWAGELPKKTNGKPVIRPVLDDNGKPQFAELLVAAELGAAGALWWCWIDTFNQVAFRQGMFDVPPLRPPDDALRILGRLWAANGGTLHGAWDAFAVFPDGRVSFREVKRRGYDRLNQAQHRFAVAAHAEIPGVDLAVVEWSTA